MNRFLVQVNKNGGYTNIINNRRYENPRWNQKPRDVAHGDVNPGDELIIYCTSDVPNYGQSLACSTVVMSVSHDNVTFNLGEPRWFPSPVKRSIILELARRNDLPKEFEACGQQGFNIAKIDASEGENVMRLLGIEPPLVAEIEDPRLSISESDGLQSYDVDSILAEGCFLDRAKLDAMLQRLLAKRNLIL